MNACLPVRFLIAALQLVASLPAHAQNNSVDPTVVELLRSKAVPKWESWEGKLQSVDVNYTISRRVGTKPNLEERPRLHGRYAYDAIRQLTLVRLQSEENLQRMQHEVANSHYQFQVVSPGPHGRCILDSLKVRDVAQSQFTVPENSLPDFEYVREQLLAPGRIDPFRAGMILNKDLFQPIKVQNIMEQGRELIQYQAKCIQPANADMTRDAVYSVLINPQADYRIEGYVIDYPDGMRDTIQNTYHDTSDIPPAIHRISLVRDLGTFQDINVWEYDRPKKCEIADAEFYLPHYGISEAVLETLQPNPWPRWLLIGFGIVTIAIGAWLVRGRQRVL